MLLYFDHNATTFVLPEIAEVFANACTQVYGNPSSIHHQGQLARRELERARRAVANVLGIAPAEFVWTSGGTESNNLAIFGVIRAARGATKHVVTTTVEHPAVLEPCRQLAREGVEVTYVRVDGTGTVTPEDIARAIRPETVLVSVMHANNETGNIQPIEEIASAVRSRRSAGQEIYLHSDGVQALGKLPLNLRELGVDLYSISAHKVFAPKGIGGLFVRKGVPFHGMTLGGRHEGGRRAGTENVAGAMAFARAMELVDRDTPTHLASLRDEFESRLRDSNADVEINAFGARRLPNTSNVLFRGISGEALVIALDLKGIAVSTGSACSSGSLEPSHVLLAMGRSYEEARSSVRFSFGRYQKQQDVRALVEAVSACLKRLRSPSRAEAQLVG